MNFLILALTVFLIMAPCAFSQGPPSRTAIAAGASSSSIDYETVHLSKVATAVRIREKITLDGQLEEGAWKLATPATDFVQQKPHTGELATQRTETRFLFDDDNLYVGFTCFDADVAHSVV